MFTKLKTIASFSILFGVVLVLAKVNIYNVSYILTSFGLIFLIISQIAINEEKSFFCRIGLHKYERIGRDSEMKAMFLYKCERCGKQMKAATLI